MDGAVTGPGPATAPPPLDPAVKARVEEWKAKLIDLSRMNRLLNARTGRGGAVRIVEEDPTEIEGLLEAGRKLGLDPREEGAPPSAPGVLRTGDTRLQTDLPEAALAKTLQRLYRESRASVEEQGFHTLFLALGTLTFSTPDDPRPWVAPLLLLPVELRRKGARSELLLGAADDDLRVNPALLVKLQRELGVQVPLPEDPETWSFAEVAEAFRKAVASRAGWSVGTEVALGLYSFAKIPLYQDLLDHGETIASHPIVWSLASGRAHPALPLPPLPGTEDVERAADPARSFQVLDADSSQGAAILAARGGASFVLQGPPGTGKSQTISNVIAEALAAGETVLFVSEKMAALEVVQRRLSAAGLGDLVLELHSRKANKREVVQSLARSWNRWSEAVAAKGGDPAELRDLQRYLRGYVSDLHAPRGAAGLPGHKILGEAARLAHVPEVAFDVGDPTSCDAGRLQAIQKALRELAEVRAAVEPLAEHPWRAAHLARLGVTTLEDLRRRLHLLHESLARAREAALALDQALGLPPAPTTPADWAKRSKAAEHLAGGPEIPAAWLHPDWVGASPRVVALLAAGRELQGLRTRLLARYDAALLAQDVAPWIVEARPGGLLLGWWRRRGVKKRLAALAKDGRGPDDLQADLRAAARARELEAEATRGEAALREAFGNSYVGPAGDFESLAAGTAWVVAFRQAWPADLPVPPEVVALAGRSDRTALRTVLERERAARSELEARWKEVAAAAEIAEPIAFPRGFSSTSADAIDSQVDTWTDRLTDLPPWTAWRSRRDEAVALGLGGYLDAFDARGLPSTSLSNGWFRAWFRAFADRVLAEVPALRAFDGRTHEARLERYRKLDRDQVKKAGDRVTTALRATVPAPAGAGVADSETGILKREMEKQTRHLPTRRLFDRVPNLLRALKPCLMMSPLSVATYLPPGSRPFDLVVFDEASQICTEDGVGALARGRRAVIAGDSRQLPPTRFFERRVEATEEPSEDVLEDLPSILDECKAGSLPQVPLQWHYRSRDESLIAFSNENFYDGGLVTFPNPARDASDLGISFVHVPDGVYLRGKSQTNPVEARVVADRVLEILRTRPGDSVGVVTFSVAQRDAVLDALEERRREDDSFEERFEAEEGEPVFVKNLEAVQGDERDVILFSVGYGHDEGGVFRMEFGPLNQDGGDRRLNVAVTRARKQVIVHASIQPEEIDLERAKSRGARLLRAYLETARRGMAIPAAAGGGAPADLPPLAAAVREELAARGLAVDADVGRSSFRIDLAVRHPDRPGRYVLAILLDGPSYARGTTLRDRDRIRPEVLGNLGWHVHRIWAPDWVRFPDREAERIVAAVEKARTAAPPAAAPPPPPPRTSPPEGGGRAPAPPAPDELRGVPGIEDYVPVELPSQGTADDFPEAALGKVAAVLLKVVKAEGPVHVGLAARRVAAAWGLSRAGSRVLERVEAAAAHLAGRGEVERLGAFLIRPGGQPIMARRAAEAGVRTIDQICPEEIEDAVLKVAKACYSAPRESLLRETARALGFARPGARLYEVLDGAVTTLVAAGRLRLEGDRVSV